MAEKRKCYSCDKVKPVEQFSKKNKGKCQDCVNAQQRKNYAKNPNYKAVNAKRQAKFQKNNPKYKDRYKEK